MRPARLLATLAALGAGPATAANTELGGYVEARAGYGTNPFVQFASDRGSGLLGATIAPRVTRTTTVGSTVLTVTYDRDEYLRNYLAADTRRAAIVHKQRLSDTWNGQVAASYSSAINPIRTDTDLADLDPFTIGTRSRRLDGNFSLSGQLTARDAVTIGATGSHARFNGATGLSDYRTYSANAGYARTVSGNTQLGVRIAVSRTEPDLFAPTRSIQPGVTLAQKFSAIWAFNGTVGVLIQHANFATGEYNGKGLSFDVSLCGAYPSTSVCLTGSRQQTTSGLGGARLTIAGGITITHQLTSISSVGFSGKFSSGKAQANLGPPPSRALRTSVDYQHKLDRRWSAGLEGRFQTRNLDGVGSAHSLAIAAKIRLLIGQVDG